MDNQTNRWHSWYLAQLQTKGWVKTLRARASKTLLPPHVKQKLRETCDEAFTNSREEPVLDAGPNGKREVSDSFINDVLVALDEDTALSNCKQRAKLGPNGSLTYKMSVWDKVKLWFIISFIIDYVEDFLSK